jgi:hypothetical protein
MSYFPAFAQSSFRFKKNYAGTSQAQVKGKAVQHFLIQYRMKTMDAGMPLPALVS